MERLESFNALAIQQKKEWGEIITDFETRNRYTVFGSDGNPLFLAAEEEGSFLLRWFLKALRPFRIRILDMQGESVLSLHRSFRFYFMLLKSLIIKGNWSEQLKGNFRFCGEYTL